MLQRIFCLLATNLILSSCVVAVRSAHDRSATVLLEEQDHSVTFSFANRYDRDSSGRDRPGGVRMHVKMKKQGPMRLKLGQAFLSRKGAPWRTCTPGKQAYNAGGERPFDQADFARLSWLQPNYFNVLLLCPAETVPADRSRGYAGLDPLKRGAYRIRASYRLNGIDYSHEVPLKLSREVQAAAGTLVDAFAPWTRMGG